MSATIRWLFLLPLMWSLACAGDKDKKPKDESQQQAKNQTAFLKAHQVLLPDGSSEISQIKVLADEDEARSIQGQRILQTAHASGDLTQLPHSENGLGLLQQADTTTKTIDVPTQDDGDVAGDVCTDEEKCLSVCATASAGAVAAAFAHASATSCAFAKAWACVYDVNPFRKACTWASSTACVTAFQSAFSFAFAYDTDTQCKSTCAE